MLCVTIAETEAQCKRWRDLAWEMAEDETGTYNSTDAMQHAVESGKDLEMLVRRRLNFFQGNTQLKGAWFEL
jgi:hypothetical protein